MKSNQNEAIRYELIRSERATADIVIERDGSIVVRAPIWANDEQVANIVESKHYWIYQGLAERRDLNATRVLREFKNGEGFLYLGRAYRLSLVTEQNAPLQLKDGRFTLRRDLVERGDTSVDRAAFQRFYIAKGDERIRNRVDYFAPKVGVHPISLDVKELGHRWAACSAAGRLSFHWKCRPHQPSLTISSSTSSATFIIETTPKRSGTRWTRSCRTGANARSG